MSLGTEKPACYSFAATEAERRGDEESLTVTRWTN